MGDLINTIVRNPVAIGFVIFFVACLVLGGKGKDGGNGSGGNSSSGSSSTPPVTPTEKKQ